MLFSLTEGVTNWYPLFYLLYNYENFTFFVSYFVPSNFGIANKILISLQTQIPYVQYESRTNITVKEMKKTIIDLILVILEKKVTNVRCMDFSSMKILSSSLRLCLYDSKLVRMHFSLCFWIYGSHLHRQTVQSHLKSTHTYKCFW